MHLICQTKSPIWTIKWLKFINICLRYRMTKLTLTLTHPVVLPCTMGGLGKSNFLKMMHGS